MTLSDEKLDRRHHSEIDDCIKKLQSEFSEYSFSNLYLFRRQHDYRVLRSGGHIFLQGVTYDGIHYLMPFSPLKDMGEPFIRKHLEEGFCLFPVSEQDLSLFPESEYKYEFNDDDSDYIYTRLKIQTYPGRHLHKKRNLVKQYRTLYQYKDIPYSCDLAVDAKKALDKWFELSGAQMEETDYVACNEAIAHCSEFRLSGQVYYADGQPTGFLLGEELNESTFVIHFAKGVTDFKGIYAHMYSSLAESLPEKYTTINFEQDLGKPTLRQAKSTYLVDRMLRKYRISLK